MILLWETGGAPELTGQRCFLPSRLPVPGREKLAELLQRKLSVPPAMILVWETARW